MDSLPVKEGAGLDKMVTTERKTSIRRELRNVRASMDVNEWRSGSLLIADRVFQMPEFCHATSVMLYLSMNDRREVNTEPLIRRVAAAGNIRMFVPFSSGETLCAVSFSEGDPVVPGRYGQPEPASGRTCEHGVPDIVVVPAVAVDRKGRRLGYGKGYYDRFIAGLRRKGKTPFVLALVFSFQLVNVLPEEPWDEKLDGVVTEKEVLRF